MAVSAQRRRRVLVAVVAALIAAGAFVLALTYTSKPGTGTGAPGAVLPTPTPAPSATVVESTITIQAGGTLTASDLTAVSVPLKYLPAGTPHPYFTSVADLTRTTTYAAENIPAGAVITSSMVTTSQASAGNPAIPGTSWQVPQGYVAMALPYTTTTGQGAADGDGVGGYLVAGDRIDILALVNPVNPSTGALTGLQGPETWAYQDVLVLAVGQGDSGAPGPSPGASPSASSGPASTGGGGLIIVEVPQQDAANLMAMKDAKNVFLQYLLVAKGDYPQNGAAGPQPIAGPSPAGLPQPVG